jgi:hypothetical protein
MKAFCRPPAALVLGFLLVAAAPVQEDSPGPRLRDVADEHAGRVYHGVITDVAQGRGSPVRRRHGRPRAALPYFFQRTR